MAYTPTTWTTGDTVTAALLNKMEQGIAGAGGIIFAQVNEQTLALNMTVQQLITAMESSVVYLTTNWWETTNEVTQYRLNAIFEERDLICVQFATNGGVMDFYASSLSDYPVINMD